MRSVFRRVVPNNTCYRFNFLYYYNIKLFNTEINEELLKQYESKQNEQDNDQELKQTGYDGNAPTSMDIISHSSLDYINKKQRKKIDLMEEKISIILETGFQVYEYGAVPIWNEKTLFQVGHLNQFKLFAQDNIFKLFDLFMYPVSDTNQWIINNQLKRELNLNKNNIKSIIDYYPFNNTFKSDKSDKSVKSVKSVKNKNKSVKTNWKLIENELNPYNKLRDSLGVNLPYLVNNNSELLIFRDIHSSINNMQRINKLINAYKPDIIVLEGNCDESVMKLYNKSVYNIYLKLINNIFSRIIPYKYNVSFGGFMNKLSDILFVRNGEMQCSSFANQGIMQFMRSNNNNDVKQPILIFSDLTLDINLVLMMVARYFDTFQLPMLLSNGYKDTQLNVKNGVIFDEIYRKLYENMDDYNNLINILNELLTPHQTVVTNYRNHFLSIAINEAIGIDGYNDCKILGVMGVGHVNDVIYKLQNINKENVIVNPFKNVTDKKITLKSNIPIVTDNHMDKLLNEKEQEFVVNEFGQNLLDLLQTKLKESKTNENVQ